METSSEDRARSTASFVLTTLVTAILAGTVAVAFPLLYEVRETRGAATAVGVALVAFVLAPLLGAIVDWIVGTRLTLAAGTVALVAARQAIQGTHPIPLWLVAAGVSAGLIALGATIVSLPGGRRLAAAVVTGLSVDAGIRAAFQTWDPTWQTGIAPTVVSVALCAATVAALVAVLRLGTSVGTGSLRAGVVMGPFLLLQLLFLHNLAFQASEAALPLTVAYPTAFGADVLALAIVSSGRVASSSWRRAAALGVIVGGATLALTSLVIPAVLVTQSAAVVLLAATCASRSTGPPWRTYAGLSLGLLGFVLFAFAYQIDVGSPLPLPRASWPIAAAVLLAVLGVRRDEPATGRVPPWVLGVPAAALAVALLLWPTYGSRPEPVTVDGDRIVQWNVHTALNAHGQIDPETIARTIETTGANVVVLEEVGRGWPIAGQVDELSWLARRLDMHAAWASAGDDQFGNAILSAYPLAEIDVLHLPYGDGPQHRSALRAVLPDGVWVVGAHLEGSTVETRTAQAEAILDRWGDHLLVLAGDLNMQPGQPDQHLYVAAGLVSAQDTLGDPAASTARDPAFPGDRVDWIWISATGLRADGFAIVPTDASDHLPLVVTVRVPGPGR